MKTRQIVLKKVKVHNLKEVDLTLNSNELIVFSGVSGSGKSSLAFDTIYIEGQRRYIESLSAYARRYLGDFPKPDVEWVSGLSPTISIEQKTSGKNPRSTVGTMTEIYDYLRVLYARIGVPYCPISGEPVMPQSKEKIIKSIQNFPNETKLILLAPTVKGKKGEFQDYFQYLIKKGFTRIRIDGKFEDLSEEISLDKHGAHDIDVVIDRITINDMNRSRIAEGVMMGLEMGEGLLLVLNLNSQEEILYSTFAFSPKSGISYTSLEPQDFSFNHPSGMCSFCHGLGKTQEFSLDLVVDSNKSIAEDACLIASSYKTVKYGNIYNNLARIYRFSVHTPWKDLSEKAKKIFLYGTENKWTSMHFVHPTRNLSWKEYIQWKGVLNEAMARYNQATSELYKKNIEKLMQKQVCSICHGSRLKPYPAAARLQGKKIHEFSNLSIKEALHFIDNLFLSSLDTQIAEELIKEIKERLQFLSDVGLDYLSLNRESPSLSGGEAQRVRLASQVGSGLVGVTYVLDEPSIGLHPTDNERLLKTLLRLRDLGNTVIVVEHDEETIREADRIVDFGPGPGYKGGKILVNGTLKDLIECKDSLTGAYLSGSKKIAVPQQRKIPSLEHITIYNASHNNLKNINVRFPIGLFIAVTGVSGSGKSSLISDTLYPALSNHLHKSQYFVGKHSHIEGIDYIHKIIAIDQSPIGRNPRSNPATYIKIFDIIRELYSSLPESKSRGYTSGRFSFNVSDGSCPSCRGLGYIRLDMDFMEDQWIACSLCKSKRFDYETLQILYKGKSIHDILEMTIEEGAHFFANIPTLKRKLDMILKVGLGYIKLGQPSPTLSGGEAQRMKLAKELVRPTSGKTLYILDEPTTGLHFEDINTLLEVLHNLVKLGNTILVIEHNMDVIKTADWVIDLGPKGGIQGGEIMGEGTPETIANLKTSTGNFLKKSLFPPSLVLDKISQKKRIEEIKEIVVEGASQNNLKHIDLSIPRGKITICTGPSGSGKSSLAFETVYAEGQRRYTESLSPYARQFVQQMPKPKVTRIEGLSPSVAIEQKAHAGNPRSTLGTMTEIYDYLRILFARLGVPHAPETGNPIRSITKDYVVEQILHYPDDEKIVIMAPIHLSKNESFKDTASRLARQGYLRIKLNKELYELDQEIPFDKKRKNEIAVIIDRIKISTKGEKRLFEACETASHLSEGKILIERENGEEILFNLSFADPGTGKSYPEITPHTFSFNNAEGMCLDCQGLGTQYSTNLTENPAIMKLTLLELLDSLWFLPFKRKKSNSILSAFEKMLKKFNIPLDLPLKELENEQLQFIFRGGKEGDWQPISDHFSLHWLGIGPVLAKLAKSAIPKIREPLSQLLDEIPCISCEGTRLNPLARNVRIGSHSIATLAALPLEETALFIDSLKIPLHLNKILDEVINQLKARMKFLIEVGLGYLSMDRKAPTLSNGETQRTRLGRQLGSELTGVLYVLDEPTVGLHPYDNDCLNQALQKLKDLGNTLLLVEHDPLTIQTADMILDFGPGAGIHGGHLLAKGTYKEILKNPNSLTGTFLSGAKSISSPNKRRQNKGTFEIQGASIHNLKNISLSFPIGCFTALSGVSGSGKSTLLHQVIRPLVEKSLFSKEPLSSVTYENSHASGLHVFQKLIIIGQNPVGHTHRADVGTYTDLLSSLREFYASLALSRTKGLQPKNFSYNHRKGMCTTCWGLGYKKIELVFLPPVKVICNECQGLRLNPVSLEVAFEGRNFGQLLQLTVDEARNCFTILPKAKRILDMLISVGLGYLKIGQEIATLSMGEAQRIKLSKELSKRTSGKTLYLLDEPTSGLHFIDIQKLLEVLQRLVDKGNTVIMIEHNLDMIKNADYLIDLGPGAGIHGGEVLAQGTPEEVAKNPLSLTGRYLRQVREISSRFGDSESSRS